MYLFSVHRYFLCIFFVAKSFLFSTCDFIKGQPTGGRQDPVRLQYPGEGAHPPRKSQPGQMQGRLIMALSNSLLPLQP